MSAERPVHAELDAEGSVIQRCALLLRHREDRKIRIALDDIQCVTDSLTPDALQPTGRRFCR